uniref:6-carboxytetrahydropterin synthase n=1 Tax=Staphylococcus haemolyticus TaxID=1283 RepID=UPI0016432263
FNEVDGIYNKVIEGKLNDEVINERLGDMNRTAENIGMWIWEEFEEDVGGEDCMYGLEVFEREGDGVSVNGWIMKL